MRGVGWGEVFIADTHGGVLDHYNAVAATNL